MCEDCKYYDRCINIVAQNKAKLSHTCPELAKPIKVFGCTTQLSHSGGIVLVAARSVEEAFLTAAQCDKLEYLFDWHDEEGCWTPPDGNINRVSSDWYPLGDWKEYPLLSANVEHPRVILEESHEG